MKLITMSLAAALVAAGCSSGLPKNTTTEFKTRITHSGLKHFQLRLVPENMRAEPPQATDLTRQPPKKRNPDRAAGKTENTLIKQADTVLAENRYCRQGYWLLDKNLYGPTPWIRGECNEAATNTDRKEYPDTIERW